MNVNESWGRVSPVWESEVVSPGRRTSELIESEPDLAKLQPLRILEHLVAGSENAILNVPGALDRATDNETMQIGDEMGKSTFHVKYPYDNGFSLRLEVSQIIDHLGERGIRSVDIVAGSWGGIPALNVIYNLVKEKTISINSIFMVAAALQPHDLVPMLRDLAAVGLRITPTFLEQRQRMIRVTSGVPDFIYDDVDVLAEIVQVPTMLLVPPDGKDWWVSAMESYDRYFPNSTKIKYPAYRGWWQKSLSIGGHDSSRAGSGIRTIEREFLSNSRAKINLPSGFELL